MENKTIKLYDYQEKCVETAIKSLSTNKKNMIVIPTGGGKTVIFCEIIKRLGLKTLIITHTQELLKQAFTTAIRMGIPEKLFSVESIQKISNHKSSFNFNQNFDLIIIDECHRGAAPTYLKLINAFPKAHLLGVTATPYRTDQKKITSIFGYPQEPLTLIDLIEKRFLCDLHGFRIKTPINLENIPRSSSTSDFSSGSLANVINVKNRNEIIVNSWLKYGENRKTLGFAATVSHAYELMKEFESKGISSEVIEGSLSSEKRKNLLKSFHRGDIQVLWNCQILTEGFDEPSIQCLLIARPTLSKRLYIQMIGRGTRLYPGKQNCNVIEFTDNEYDVCDLRDLLELPKTKKPIERGESFLGYYEKIKPDLLEGSGEIVLEQMKFTYSTATKQAPDFILNLLKSYNISFNPGITEIEANRLLKNHLNTR